MADVVEKNDVVALTGEIWLRDARSNFDVATELTAAMGPSWTVERELDPSGELSIIVLPVIHTTLSPTFILYEEDGLVQVSIFFGEDWRQRQAFRTCQRAVAAISATALLSERALHA